MSAFYTLLLRSRPYFDDLLTIRETAQAPFHLIGQAESYI